MTALEKRRRAEDQIVAFIRERFSLLAKREEVMATMAVEVMGMPKGGQRKRARRERLDAIVVPSSAPDACLRGCS